MYGTRGKLAEVYLHKQEFDESFENFDKSSWYAVSKERLYPRLQETFFQSSYGPETDEFLQNSREISDSVFLQLYYSLATAVLQLFMTKTTSNGLLRRGSMFLFPSEQLGNFLGFQEGDFDPSGRFMIDLGAGDGSVTEKFQKFYSNVYVTETSKTMLWRLQEKEFNVLPVETWDSELPDCHLISALNLLDRIPKPVSFLRQLHCASSKFRCPVLLAVVFPWYQYCEFGLNNSTEPEERISVTGVSLEEHVADFVDQILIRNNFRVLKWTKLPYLCEGDAYQSFYVLTNVAFLIEPV